MRIFIALILLALSLSTHASDGVVLQITIDSEVASGNKVEKSSYTNGVLVELNSTNEFKFENLYKIKVVSKSADGKNLNLIFTINQFFGEKLYYIGDKAIEIPIGESKQFELASAKSHYKVSLSTAFGNPELIAK